MSTLGTSAFYAYETVLLALKEAAQVVMAVLHWFFHWLGHQQVRVCVDFFYLNKNETTKARNVKWNAVQPATVIYSTPS